jgi:hypothetical protein
VVGSSLSGTSKTTTIFESSTLVQRLERSVKTMKKNRPADAVPEMRDEYDFSGGVRGKYASRVAEGTNIVVLDPDVAEVFGDAKAVNDALRVLAESVRKGKQRVS